MTRKLEELFGLDPAPPTFATDTPSTTEDTTEAETVTRAVTSARQTLNLITSALPAVRELADIDAELDDIAKRAMEGYDELADLGMQVDSRFAAEIFSVASSMMGHAISAKTAKASRKLKTLELQLKTSRLEMDMQKRNEVAPSLSANTGAIEVAEGQVLSRNELMRMLNPRDGE